MKKTVLSITAFFIFMISFSQSTEITSNDPCIYVTGKAKIEIVPDEIYLKVILSENNRNDKETLASLEQSFLLVLEKLKISKEDLSLSDASLGLIRIPWQGKKVVKTKKYQVMVKNVGDLSELIDTLTQLEIKDIHITKVNHSDIEGIKKQLRIKAITNAKEKAEYLTQAIGKDLGDLLEITENAPFDRFDPFQRGPDAIASTVGGVSKQKYATESISYNEISFEKMILEASINLKYKIKN